jgi:hypothetical protein
LDRLKTDDTTAAADVSNATPFASGSYYPDFCVANNLAFFCNGQPIASPSGATGIKFSSAGVQRWGIIAPTGAPTITANAAAGSHSGTYEARIAYYNSNTGHESSAGPTSSTLTLTSKKINWSWSASSDAQSRM